MEHSQSVETPRRLREIRAAQRHDPEAYVDPPMNPAMAQAPPQEQPNLPTPVYQPPPPGIPSFAPGTTAFVMPRPHTPFVEFRFSDSDEAAYGIVTAYGDRTLDIGVIAKGHPRVQHMDGVRHFADPDMARLREHVPGVWRELPQIESLFQTVEHLARQQMVMAARLDSVDAALDQATKPAEPEEFDAGEEVEVEDDDA